MDIKGPTVYIWLDGTPPRGLEVGQKCFIYLPDGRGFEAHLRELGPLEVAMEVKYEIVDSRLGRSA